ncbi:uncharacterized protein L969DRAFT_129471 [Mixia osmundae IAM 14324]|uniref:Uncharacterized protein n=1 Tax=Mixia osmundae (strain CBS 9802 / IAM 14324 / JCM 22182 / KY 12970) TaxID=764103 RepID=G7DZU7_MIXOS|nr:uncharacterized protein L969DRAFT_129471 [Mixia osmundae IAM 14324]KEI42100.1 hypothetical protein L969DRAFT_129471 [Mixia osmundae IAM 14324]GAA96107.1 hypothetical protein E5Q_02768 [Mixia osmundae IAM 14324]
MTRSQHKHKQEALTHDYKTLGKSASVQIKKNGAGRHSWGNDQLDIHDSIDALDEIPDRTMPDPRLSTSPQVVHKFASSPTESTITSASDKSSDKSD